MIQSNSYSIVTDAEVSSIIANFSPEMINDILDYTLLNKQSMQVGMVMNNMVASNETALKAIMSTYGDYLEELKQTRENLYNFIIQKLCSFHHLQYNGDVPDLYSAAFCIYRFLVSEFSLNVIRFYVNYILKEKNAIYQQLEMAELKKNKDSSSTYSKKIYRNSNNKLAVIHANLEFVIDGMRSYDITLEDVINNIYVGEPNMSKFLISILQDNGDFFRTYIAGYINDFNKPEIITYIRLQLQGMYTTTDLLFEQQ